MSEFTTRDIALKELHDFVACWKSRHALDGPTEIEYLKSYVNARADIIGILQRIKEWPDLYKDE